MEDTGITMVTIIKVALKIKAAADTARQNKADCAHVKSRVDALQQTMEPHKQNKKLMKMAAAQAALKLADEVLAKALEVVNDCQKERSILFVLCGAEELSKELSKVETRITGATTSVIGAVQVYIAMRLSRPWYRRWFGGLVAAIRLPQAITAVVERIKTATETVQQNKEDFMEIEKRASSVSEFMSLLKDKDYMKLVNQESMKEALEKLLRTFDQAHTLVMISCRETRINVILCAKWKLRRVLGKMLRDISSVNRIVMDGLTEHAEVPVNGER